MPDQETGTVNDTVFEKILQFPGYPPSFHVGATCFYSIKTNNYCETHRYLRGFFQTKSSFFDGGFL